MDTSFDALAPAPFASQAGNDASVRLLRRFRVVFNAVKTHFREVEKQAGLGGAQVWALSIVQKHPGMGVGELARAMDIHQSTASNLVKSLAQQQLLLVERLATDRRSVRLTLLPGALDVLRRAPGPFNGILPVALRNLDEDTLLRLEEDLDKLVQVLHADDPAEHQPTRARH